MSIWSFTSFYISKIGCIWMLGFPFTNHSEFGRKLPSELNTSCKRYSKFSPNHANFLLWLKTFSFTEHTVINSTACGAAVLPLRNKQQLCFYFESDMNTSDFTVSSLKAMFPSQVWSLTRSQSLSSAHSRASWGLYCCSLGLLKSQPGAQLAQKHTTEEEFTTGVKVFPQQVGYILCFTVWFCFGKVYKEHLLDLHQCACVLY